MVLRVHFEAHGAHPNFRHDIIQPLRDGRVAPKGIELTFSAPLETAPFFVDSRFRDGDFGIADINLGDAICAIDAGWNIACLPVFMKRKPPYAFLWVRADRGIDTPKDLEGRRVAAAFYGSAISIYLRGVLAHVHGVDLARLHWIVGQHRPTDRAASVGSKEIALDAKRLPQDRLLAGEVDACFGDINAREVWAAMELSSSVRRLFPRYCELTLEAIRRERHFIPSHVIVIGGGLLRSHPTAAEALHQAFVEARDMALVDAEGDATGYSTLLFARETLRDQIETYGDLFAHGFAANRPSIEMLLESAYRQGITGRRLQAAEILAPGTLST